MRKIKSIEDVREATDDREDFYTITPTADGGSELNLSKLGIVAVAVIALIFLGILIF